MPEAYGGQTLTMKVALSRLTTLAAGAAALAFFLACGGTGHAHDTPMSAATLQLKDVRVVLRLRALGRDLESATGARFVSEANTVERDPLDAARAAVAGYAARTTRLVRGDGGPCPGAVTRVAPNGDGVLVVLEFPCGLGEPGLTYRTTFLHGVVPGVVQHLRVIVDGEVRVAALDAGQPELVLTEAPPPPLDVFARYMRSGVEHIFLGYDHVAFLLALLLWARRLGPVVKVVTAFTLAHSVTLSLAVLDLVVLPGRVVEPLIAASIVWVAVENFLSRDVGGRWRVAFALGLVHGFGFAGVLREFGLPGGQLGLALGAFNLGVEVGQVAIVAVAIPLLRLADRLGAPRAGVPVRRPTLVYALSAVVVLLGLYWLAERTLLA